MGESITTYYLEMLKPSWLRPSGEPEVQVELRRIEEPQPALNRFFYERVGATWRWLDRLAWDDARWMAWLGRPEVETWVLYHGEEQAGYFELESQAGDQVEIIYFGLLPDFMGKKLGGYLLTRAIRRAWQLGTRVWVHTCSLDHPAALANYRARGFRVYKEETSEPCGDEGSR